MKVKTTLQELLPNEFEVGENEELVAKVSLERLTLIASAITQQHEEIERLKIQVSARETEYERLHSIIKEARDYITTIKDEDIQYTIGWVKQDILQILDKVGENK